MFKFQLALRLGRTVSELDQTMSAREFDLWQAFNVFEPVGILREDALFANLIKTYARTKGLDDISMSDFMLFRDREKLMVDPDEEILPTDNDIEDICVNLKAMFSKVI
ncbi:phage tail assembly protein T [Acinetobacter modestus]|uniref:phage tail assembly protein T n=1 Tax=Acinetobacter modestus TaxID=1776740 RepID=UPI00301A75F3